MPSWLKNVLIGRKPGFTLIRIIVLVILTIVIFPMILIPIRVQGISMEPTYVNGKINFINRMAYWRHEPRRGDIVGIRFSGHSVMYMKRVIGLPGERVAFHRGTLYINGELIDEPYVKLSSKWTMPEKTLEADEYFVVGDNRGMPMSDHYFGKAERKRILGKVLL